MTINNETTSRDSDSKLHTDEAISGIEKTPKVPDGGWGWVVCAACFLVHLLIDGLFYSFGVIYVELLEYYGSSKGSTALIGSLCPGVLFLIGPVVSILARKYGCRPVAVTGALVAFASQIASIFAPNMQFLYFSLGVMTGFGYGLIYLPSIVCVVSYFDKRRSLAIGIGVSGTGIGTFIFSPITSLLVQEYAWQGAILIHAGLLLNCVACGLVFVPLEEHEPVCENKDSVAFYAEKDVALKVQNCRVDLENCHLEKRQRHHAEFTEPQNDTSLEIICGHTSKESVQTSATSPEIQALLAPYDYNDTSAHDNVHTSDLTSTDHPKNNAEKSTISCALLSSGCITSLKEHFDFKIFKLVPFNLFMVSSFLYSLGYYVPYIYLPDMAIYCGIDELDAAWLLSVVGITNTAARVLFGFLSDRKWVNRSLLYSTALIICGCSTVAAPFMKSFWSLVLYSTLFGVFGGVTISLTSVLLTDIVGIEKLSDAFGMYSFISGISVFAGPPIAGVLYDISGSYMVPYVGAGVTIAASGAILLLIPLLDKRSNSKKQ
ncbi:monocarboxylate transporter 12-like [Mya arenaria]|uniref:monocarboxylate transporter 12-like n=1 Tax=Mya arenaria TaxID=6604 RepID=UPI0022E14502|nr:monocarboxylate transporter 12-like [Mya arenaria]XP_052784505.1 monocarboxylate transporter 12-like [Mya arenaria]